MPTPRVAAIHDMSGFGRCSLTVAIPVLSAMGVQCCPLPTAYLSTHTGGFTGYTFLDMTDELPKTAAHWAELGIHFDAVYTGFMGSEAQMDLAADFVRTFRRDRSTIFICDPVMGDHGKIYKTYTPAMCAGMTRLADGRQVLARSMEKYGEAVRLYETTTEPLRSIADRLGLQYNSVGGFVRRSRPDAIEAHNRLVEREEALRKEKEQAESAALALQREAEEKERILSALRQTGGNKRKAAKLLGFCKSTLYNKLNALGLNDTGDT